MNIGRERLALGLLLSLPLLASPARAALPPQYQNAKDLDALVAFVKAHHRVIASLEGIDLSEPKA